uniref:Homeobox protein VENTX-like n=1 Tax=Dromaius novaehollandiae TaxID=8790 RepID=A0A8C4J7T2_DRONO
MTKAPFSVEWLSQSSQAPRDPAEGAPRRPSAAGPRPDPGCSPGPGERGGKEGAGPRPGRGGRSRERPAGPAAAGNRGPRRRRGIAAQPCSGGGGGKGLVPRGTGAWLTPTCARAGPQISPGEGAPGPVSPLPARGSEPPRIPDGAGGRGGRGGHLQGPRPGGRGGRRLRTAFSAEQISTLESSFQRHQYLGAAERRKLAGRMQLSEVQVSCGTWFQNRRMKLKRQLQELRPEPFCSPPLPYGPQSGLVALPLAYAARPPPLPRQEAAPGGFALAALPAPALDLSSACRAQPPGFWAAPCFLGYRDPRGFLVGV